jgi:uncharacterized protein
MVHMVAFVLLVVGGLNWLLVAFGFNLVEMIASVFGGSAGMVAKLVYILVGLSAIYELITHKSHCEMCKGTGGGM